VVEKYCSFYSLSIPAKLAALLATENKAQYSEYLSNKEALQKIEDDKAKKETQKRHKKELQNWLKGKTSRLYVRNGYDYLRIGENRIETTQAVVIPMELGKRLYLKIKAGTLEVGEKVMDYTVSETGKLVRIGCHTFEASYLLKFGQKAFN
jgi:hypothetical protein